MKCPSYSAALAWATAALLSVSCTSEPAPDAQPLSASIAAIVNGQPESGYPAVGSLVQSFFGQRSSFCTGTLIKPTWVVTAAHCVKGQRANAVSFFIGERASGSGGGQTFPAAELIYHPRYTDDTNPAAVLYDIALVRLRDAVPANVATPYVYNREALDAQVGQAVTYVGYGATSAPSQQPREGGSKRRTAVPIDRVDPLTYSLQFEGTGVCFGDSGGPGLLAMGGETRVISVVSTGNGCEGDTCDPCREAGSNHTRVDVFADWIASHVGDEFPSCGAQVSRCACPAACQEDGVCDNAVCGGASCGDALSCILNDCDNGNDGSCSQACIHSASLAAQDRLSALINCWIEECANTTTDEEDERCIAESCPAQRMSCEAAAGASLCDAVDGCVLACANAACKTACLESGTLEAQAAEPALDACRTTQCAGMTGAALRACAETACASTFDVCYPPDHCEPLVDGACPEGSTCVATAGGDTRCEPSDGDTDPVEPDAGTDMPPADGDDGAPSDGNADGTDGSEDGTDGSEDGTDGSEDGSDAADGDDGEEDAGVDMTTDPVSGGESSGGSSGGGCSVAAAPGTDTRGLALATLFGLGFAVRRRRQRG